MDILRLLKFCVVGGIGFVVGSAAFYIFTRYLGIPAFLPALGLLLPDALVLSFIVSVLNNYTLNSKFTFPSREPTPLKVHLKRLMKFSGASIVGFVVSTVTFYIATSWPLYTPSMKYATGALSDIRMVNGEQLWIELQVHVSEDSSSTVISSSP